MFSNQLCFPELLRDLHQCIDLYLVPTAFRSSASAVALYELYSSALSDIAYQEPPFSSPLQNHLLRPPWIQSTIIWLVDLLSVSSLSWLQLYPLCTPCFLLEGTASTFWSAHRAWAWVSCHYCPTTTRWCLRRSRFSEDSFKDPRVMISG